MIATQAGNARERRGLSAADVAKKLRLSEAYVLRIERDGTSCPRTGRKFALLYSCDPEIFVNGSRIEPKANHSAKTHRRKNVKTPLRRQPKQG